MEVSLDTSGRLIAFDAVPPQMEKPTAYPAPDWAPLFAAAHFDLTQFKPADPQWTPVAVTDARARLDRNLSRRSESPDSRRGRGIPRAAGAFPKSCGAWTKPTRVAGNSARESGRKGHKNIFAGVVLLVDHGESECGWRGSTGRRGEAIYAGRRDWEFLWPRSTL